MWPSGTLVTLGRARKRVSPLELLKRLLAQGLVGTRSNLHLIVDEVFVSGESNTKRSLWKSLAVSVHVFHVPHLARTFITRNDLTRCGRRLIICGGPSESGGGRQAFRGSTLSVTPCRGSCHLMVLSPVAGFQLIPASREALMAQEAEQT